MSPRHLIGCDVLIGVALHALALWDLSSRFDTYSGKTERLKSPLHVRLPR